MNDSEIQEALDESFDAALLFHAFSPYTRDYEVIVSIHADPGTGIPTAYRRYLFRYCVHAAVETNLPPEIWRKSLDERLIDFETGKELQGFVWGVRWQCLYPGAKVVPGSTPAASWAESLGVDFHEVRIETNSQILTLVFSELEVSDLPIDYAPFVLREEADPSHTEPPRDDGFPPPGRLGGT